MTDRNILAAAYDAGVDEEYNRLVSSPIFRNEFAIIKNLISIYISENSKVIDIGSGPGRYTELLLSKKCSVGAIDISSKSLQALQKRINGKYNSNFLFADTCCATKIDWVPSEYADAALLMGPLYHLTQVSERIKALEHAHRILKPGGIIISVFMSIYPVLAQLTDNTIENFPEECVTEVLFQGYPIEQYRCCPECAEALLRRSGFKTIVLNNLDFFADVNDNLNTGQSSQFVYVGRKVIT